MLENATGRTLVTEEPRETPWLSVVFGYGPMLPFVAGAAAAWWQRGQWDELILLATILYGAAILLFLSGVRRGVSFRTEGGPTFMQIATMLGLFCLGLGALLTVVILGNRVIALDLLIAGFVAIAILDPIAARRGEAPLFFARLRPLQIPIAVLSLVALLVLKLMAPY
ncbi:DUF3429 domain-containing protein [Methylobacterium gregans]|uniref:DUF3429 domain-containing protein n=1 Tax=Methylobacterium gregans TaxID=374424 RepID=A0AA37HL30_9HYPH|nr:DUF3429 family protein [Methylobacterium gregans]MDQ0519846.1 hypothetical protein [Methylobacterium gregans]GJD77573.1 hypothetical protein NBEOAGPD_0780 [Methylobacterium gregans]GLS54034.1 hypothetical protein GCM10007886_22170 [Methylobacterium gregans]